MDISNQNPLPASGRLFDRAVIRVSPADSNHGAAEDVRDFLQGLVTQDTQAALPLWAGLLSPQGKALFDFFLWADAKPGNEGDILIDCEAAQAGALVRRLSLYRLRRKIIIAVDTGLAVYWARYWAAYQANEDAAGTPDPRKAEIGFRWLAAPSPNDEDAGAAYLAHRLSQGVTEGIAELGSEQTLWLEANAVALNGVSFSKGCYVGQENTARMNWRQKVSRSLVVVPIAQADLKRQRIAYPQLGLSVELRRVET
jgi:folate-binding protein YgfZ